MLYIVVGVFALSVLFMYVCMEKFIICWLKVCFNMFQHLLRLLLVSVFVGAHDGCLLFLFLNLLIIFDDYVVHVCISCASCMLQPLL